MKKKIYLAYGSNLNLEQMAFRCPDAKAIGTTKLLGWKLSFRGEQGCAFATIEEHTGSAVPVLLWEISEADERKLDRYEGWPSHYYKQDVQIFLDGKMVTAMVYIMVPRPLAMPSEWYFKTIQRGYDDCRFSHSAINKALRESQGE
jgi:gamma-glutamylcyclotransferase (GGCT)/AIG2-like uncharacterized protein YtfP